MPKALVKHWPQMQAKTRTQTTRIILTDISKSLCGRFPIITSYIYSYQNSVGKELLPPFYSWGSHAEGIQSRELC